MSQKPMPVVSFVPAVADLKLDPNYKRVWRVEFLYHTELRGDQPGTPFVFTLPSTYPKEKVKRAARTIMMCHLPDEAIGGRLTAVQLSTPLTNKRD